MNYMVVVVVLMSLSIVVAVLTVSEEEYVVEYSGADFDCSEHSNLVFSSAAFCVNGTDSFEIHEGMIRNLASIAVKKVMK